MKSMKIRNHVPAIIIIALFIIILVAGFWSVLSHLNPSMSRVRDFVSDRLGDRSPLSVIRNLSQDMPNETNSATNLNHTYTSPFSIPSSKQNQSYSPSHEKISKDTPTNIFELVVRIYLIFCNAVGNHFCQWVKKVLIQGKYRIVYPTITQDKKS